MRAQFGFSGCGVPVFPTLFSTTFPKIVIEVMTSGLPQVCKLWLWVSKGMLPVKHLEPKILMAVNYCGRQLARRLGLVAPAYHKKEGVTQYPAACKFSLQYDWRSDERFGVWFGTWNLDSLSGKGETFVKNRERG